MGSDRRALRLSSTQQLVAVHDFLARTEELIQRTCRDGGSDDDGLSEAWLHGLCREHRNVVQLTEPASIATSDAEAGLDMLFGTQILDVEVQSRGYVTKSGVVADVREIYRNAAIRPDLLLARAQMRLGDGIRTNVDLAVANGVAYQLTQAFSFQRATAIDDVSLAVKAWGYAINRLRDGAVGVLVAPGSNHVSPVPVDVDVQVAVAEPKTASQIEAYKEARRVFNDLGVDPVGLSALDSIGAKAVELVAADQTQVLV